jgi:hypothetical protein
LRNGLLGPPAKSNSSGPQQQPNVDKPCAD